MRVADDLRGDRVVSSRRLLPAAKEDCRAVQLVDLNTGITHRHYRTA